MTNNQLAQKVANNTPINRHDGECGFRASSITLCNCSVLTVAREYAQQVNLKSAE